MMSRERARKQGQMFFHHARSAATRAMLLWPWVVRLLPAVVAGLMVFVLGSIIGQPLEVAHVTASDGTEMLITQTFPDGIFFWVGFYAKKPNGPWYEYYLEHEADYWRASIELDEASTRARIRQDGSVVAVFNWTSGVLEKAPGSAESIGMLQGHPLDRDAGLVDSGFPDWTSSTTPFLSSHATEDVR